MYGRGGLVEGGHYQEQQCQLYLSLLSNIFHVLLLLLLPSSLQYSSLLSARRRRKERKVMWITHFFFFLNDQHIYSPIEDLVDHTEALACSCIRALMKLGERERGRELQVCWGKGGEASRGVETRTCMHVLLVFSCNAQECVYAE